MQDLEDWAEENGIFISKKIKIVQNLNYNKVIARTGIEPDDRLISCPEHILIGPKHADAVYPEMDKTLRKQPYIKLTFLHEYKLGERSKWHRYIQLLPQTAKDTIPIFFSEPGHKLIEGTNLAAEFREKLNNWKKEFQLYDGQAKGFSEDEYIWASMIFTSRAFPSKLVYPQEDDSLSMLIPIVDLLNHKPYTVINWNNGGDKFELVTGQNISKDEEVFNNYGAKGNEELLLGYGFCIENNPFDNVPLKLGSTEGAKQHCKQLDVDLPENDLFFLSKHEGLVIPRNLTNVFSAIMAFENGYYYGAVISKLHGLEMLSMALNAKLVKITSLTEPFDNNDLTQVFASWYTNGVRFIYELGLKHCQGEILKLLQDDAIIVLDLEHAEKHILNGALAFYNASSIDDLIDNNYEDEIMVMQITSFIVRKTVRIRLSAPLESLEEYEAAYNEWKGILPEFSGPNFSLEAVATAGVYFGSDLTAYRYRDHKGRMRLRGIIEL